MPSALTRILGSALASAPLCGCTTARLDVTHVDEPVMLSPMQGEDAAWRAERLAKFQSWVIASSKGAVRPTGQASEPGQVFETTNEMKAWESFAGFDDRAIWLERLEVRDDFLIFFLTDAQWSTIEITGWLLELEPDLEETP